MTMKFYTKKLDNLDEIDNLLEAHKLPNWLKKKLKISTDLKQPNKLNQY